jgi:Abnormal spindle-like microcephaly-assoc'd, ASPM-SPD-2-Hydin
MHLGPAETPVANALLSAAPKFATTAVGSTSDAQTVTLTNGGDSPLHIDRAYLAGLNPKDFTIVTDAATGATVAPGASVNVTVAFKPTASGTRQANLSFADDAANTTDQTVALSAATPVSSTPTATAPIQSLAAVFNDPIALLSPIQNSTLPVDLTWTRTAPGPSSRWPPARTTASLGAFTGVSLQTASATSTRVRLAMGTTTGKAYQFRVRSCNSAGCGARANGPKFTLLPSDDANMAPGQFKGTWTNVPMSGVYGGTLKRSWTSANATLLPAVTFTVSGNAARVSTLGPDHGMPQAQVDGGSPQLVDLYSPTVQTGRVVWAGDALAVGTHTVTLTVLGKRSPLNAGACNTGSKCAQVDIDLSTIIK